MAGGTITRIALGSSSTVVEGDYTGFYDTLTMNAGANNAFKAKVTNHGNPKEPPPVGKYFKKGWWTDDKDKTIKEALIGQTVKFHIEMEKSKVPAGSKINFILKDWDGMLNPDDDIKLYSTTKDYKTNTYPEIKEMVTDANGKASLFVTLTEGLAQFAEDDGGNEIELYFACTYYNKSDKETEQLDLPVEEFNYLIVYEKEVLITVLVELPHSHYSVARGAKNIDTNEIVSALGLAGHSAMAIGDRYFDYGPDNIAGTYSEKDYDADFNKDGDKNDNVYLDSPSFMNAPGRPWWGEMVAKKLGKNAIDVKLNDVLDFIKLHWEKDGTNIYGEIHQIEFYIKESEANKMIKWWEERYKHLKIYSVLPWTGEQCTTTVKTAIQEAFPFEISGKNWIPDTTQAPGGLLQDLKLFISTSKQHLNQMAKNTLIKKEAIDYPSKP